MLEQILCGFSVDFAWNLYVFSIGSWVRPKLPARLPPGGGAPWPDRTAAHSRHSLEQLKIVTNNPSDTF